MDNVSAVVAGMFNGELQKNGVREGMFDVSTADLVMRSVGFRDVFRELQR